MAVIHHTVLKPTKLELLASWLPSRPWYRGGTDEPALAKAGGFRLDDPQGEVGIEFIVVTDASGPHPATYLVPLSYRGAPLDGAEHALVGTMEHGVLGKRWAYDGCHDPVLVAQLVALAEGRAQAQDQDVSDVPDRDVVVSPNGAGSDFADFTVTDDQEGTGLATPDGATLRLHRVLRPGPDGPSLTPPGAVGHITGSWQTQDGARVRGVFAVSYAGSRA
ncbi:1,4-alpha-glucan branching protein [Streptomyces sp. AC627_RSS907]|uniref:maltokinase N-terminal cap-like domain-containing protein n=1 Tax=Streptomyces sp. AC627_RSS907 TaxID=2823684 RepID=UPI001C21C080|nr:1,4-alpha-glucan branching protein [Streptomyces sp. AC627_RSS907]